MNKQINILYISLSGNTKAFVGKLTQYFTEQGITVNTLNVKEFPKFTKLERPFVTFLPAFLKGGNGIDNGYTEILTPILGDYLAYENNYRKCYGIIGSGNRNFNKQFALTAKQYAQHFGFPLIAEFELRGTASDVPRIAQKIMTQQAVFEKQYQK